MAFLTCTAVFWGAAAVMAISGPVGRPGLTFACLYAVAFLALAGMVRSYPDRIRLLRSFGPVILTGVVLRLLFLQFPPSFDVNRYVWEGYIQLKGFNPYLYAPDNPALSVLAQGPLKAVWEGINHKDLAAAYPPVALLIFRFLAGVYPNPLFFKMVIAGFEAAVLFPLAMIFRQRKLPPPRLLLYAANPLLLVFITGEGHLDGIMVFFLCLGLTLLFSGREGTGFFCIGCAAMVKYFAWAAVPFLITRDNWKRCWLAFLPAAAFVYFHDAGMRTFHSLFVFGTGMHYNDAITAMMRFALGDAALPVCALILAAIFAAVFLFEHDRLRSLFFAFGWLLLFLPTLHPWYLSLAAPFAALFASPGWIYLQAAMVFTFPMLAVEYTTGVFQEIHWLKLIEYGPFFAWVTWHFFSGRTQVVPSYGSIGSVSVVIPAVNEGERIADCISSIKGQADVAQIIVADGHSEDHTRAAARDCGATVVTSPRGRGRQIKMGIREVHADAVMIVHADCRLRRGVMGRVVESLNSDPQAVGGALSMTFQPADRKKRIIAALNSLRTRLSGIAFGDQCQFFRTEALPAIGGFPDQMLMEDVELSLRLKTIGRLIFLPEGVRVSGRRWESQPLTRGVGTVLKLFCLYLIQRRLGAVDEEARWYYNAYYGPSAMSKTST